MQISNKNKKFYYAILLALGVVAVIALFDIWSMNSGLFADKENYIHGNFNPNWWFLFRNFSLMLIIAIPLCYYFLNKQDKSEALAIGMVSYLMWRFGLADILFFWFQRVNVPERLEWLDSVYPINLIAVKFGYIGVTNHSLYISVIIGLVTTSCVVFILRKYF